MSVWITWEKQVRNRSLSRRFNTVFYEFDYDNNQLIRYMRCVLNTLVVLLKQKDGIVFVQNPSVLLAVLAITIKPIVSYVLVVDAHNSAIFPKQKWLERLAKFIIKKADFTIVTNKNLATYIERSGGKPLILPDPLPFFHNAEYLRNLAIDPKKVLFICSWASDEPYNEVLKAAEALQGFNFYITGKSKGKESTFGQTLPSNVTLTGYLPDDDYHEMLATSGVILDLTTREDCLVCGAYEATILERPFIVSDKEALRAYFKQGCLYVENTAEGIINGVKLMSVRHLELRSQIGSARLDMEKHWQSLFVHAESLISKK